MGYNRIWGDEMNNLGKAKNLQHYMNIYDKTRNDIARDLDIPYTTITNWLNAEKISSY